MKKKVQIRDFFTFQNIGSLLRKLFIGTLVILSVGLIAYYVLLLTMYIL